MFSLRIERIRSDHGTLTNDYGRIDNIDNAQIHVAASLTVIDCVRECVQFRQSYTQYEDEDCHAYNYNMANYACELIHSVQPLAYSIGFQTRWMTGLKS